MQDDLSRNPDTDQTAEAAGMGASNPQEETRGRDVIDRSRETITRGEDVIDLNPDVETKGVDVIDHSRDLETKGVDVIDHGPLEG